MHHKFLRIFLCFFVWFLSGFLSGFFCGFVSILLQLKVPITKFSKVCCVTKSKWVIALNASLFGRWPNLFQKWLSVLVFQPVWYIHVCTCRTVFKLNLHSRNSLEKTFATPMLQDLHHGIYLHVYWNKIINAPCGTLKLLLALGVAKYIKSYKIHLLQITVR